MAAVWLCVTSLCAQSLWWTRRSTPSGKIYREPLFLISQRYIILYYISLLIKCIAARHSRTQSRVGSFVSVWMYNAQRVGAYLILNQATTILNYTCIWRWRECLKLEENVCIYTLKRTKCTSSAIRRYRIITTGVLLYTLAVAIQLGWIYIRRGLLEEMRVEHNENGTKGKGCEQNSI